MQGRGVSCGVNGWTGGCVAVQYPTNNPPVANSISGFFNQPISGMLLLLLKEVL